MLPTKEMEVILPSARQFQVCKAGTERHGLMASHQGDPAEVQD